MPKNQVLKANVKNVLSGDSFVLVPSTFKGSVPPERILTLSYVKAPSVQANDVHSFESKEYVTNLVLGKAVSFTVLSKSATNKEFGDVYSSGSNSLIQHLVAKGIVKVKESLNPTSEEEEDFINNLYDLESKAKSDNVGLWNPSASKISVVELDNSIIEKSKNSPITSTIEKVIAGDRVIARIVVNKTTHIVTPVLLAGIKSPRTANANDATSEPFAEESKYFTSKQILGKKVKISIIGANQTGTPIAKIFNEKNEDVSENILSAGFAEIVDWQSSLIGSDIMSKLRTAEKTAKVKALGIWKSAVANPIVSPSAFGSSVKLVPGNTIEAVISRIISPDTLNVSLKNDEEHTVQLSSLKAPRQSDEKASFIPQAKEFVRAASIGKSVKVYVDAIRPENKEKNLPSRPLVTITFANGKDLSETIVSNGFASVIRHNKQTSNERSGNWDKLIELETIAQEGKKGIHSPKIPGPERIVDASENLTRSKTFLSGYIKKGKMTGIVEHIININRYRIVLPRESTKLTLLLGGLENSNNKEFSQVSEIGFKFVNKKILQREVQFEIYGTDKTGGFIGNLFVVGQALPIQSILLTNGFVKIHDISINSNKFAAEFENAEATAKEGKVGLWKTYSGSSFETDLSKQTNKLKLVEKSFYDVKVTDISNEGVISFQIIDSKTPVFKSFKKSFEEFNSLPAISSSPSSAELGTSPVTLTKHAKVGEFVAVKDSQEGTFFRAKITAFDKISNKYTVRDIDYGFVDKVFLRDLRYLPKKFSTHEMPGQAHTASLRGVKLPPSKPTDYLSNAIEYLDNITYGKQLISIAYPATNKEIEFEVTLIESSKAATPGESINKDMVAKGWGIVDKSNKSDTDVGSFSVFEAKAKADRLGCWEFGDIDIEED